MEEKFDVVKHEFIKGQYLSCLSQAVTIYLSLPRPKSVTGPQTPADIKLAAAGW